MSNSKSLNVTESTDVGVLGRVNGKKRYKARLIGVGKGSKALYTTEAMATAKDAFPKGTKVNADHMSWREKDDRPEGSILSMIGVIASEPVAEADGAYAEVEFLDEYAPLIEQIYPFVGMSIHAQCEWTEESEEGLPIVTAFVPNPLNTVDVVTVAGAKGKLLEVMESYSYGKMNTDAETERKKNKMTPEEIKALADQLIPALTEAIKPEPVKVDEATDDAEELDLEVVTESLIEAGLPKAARAKAIAAIKNGIEVEEAIKVEKSYIDELSKAEMVEESYATRKMSDSNHKEMDFSLGAWN